MLSHTRLGSTPDVGRLGAALARPGMDTRTWVSLATIMKVKVDPQHGVLADVMLLPTGVRDTARVGALYAGNGFGLYAPLVVDDEVLVAAPSGDPDEGLVVVARLWSAADPPPGDAARNPADVLLLAQAGANVRVATLGTGNVIIDPRGSGEVRLGAENAGHAACRGDSLQTSLNALVQAHNAHIHADSTGAPTSVPSIVLPNPSPPPVWLPPVLNPAVPSPATDLSPNVKVK